ncbi:hypothetical protein [Pseudonocardia sp. N23]|uniref:hypothetical protein n=1 Tax=Pseudonocardia sp. N23 TaxID=1987376 RepID=UPI000C0280DC|nr:hypothetical protein [Pseudonocardia sp. N23]GAY08013.1 pyruvate oxidase [Pseudonocardia sp. N23]
MTDTVGDVMLARLRDVGRRRVRQVLRRRRGVRGDVRPDVPPIPPHATPEQAISVLQAVLKGDPDARHLVAQGVRTKLREFLPGNG